MFAQTFPPSLTVGKASQNMDILKTGTKNQQTWGFKSSASKRCVFIFLVTELVYFIDILYAILFF